MPGLSDQGVRRGASFRRGLRAATMALAAVTAPLSSQPLYLHRIAHKGTYLHVMRGRKTMSAVTLDAFSRIGWPGVRLLDPAGASPYDSRVTGGAR